MIGVMIGYSFLIFMFVILLLATPMGAREEDTEEVCTHVECADSLDHERDSVSPTLPNILERACSCLSSFKTDDEELQAAISILATKLEMNKEILLEEEHFLDVYVSSFITLVQKYSLLREKSEQNTKYLMDLVSFISDQIDEIHAKSIDVENLDFEASAQALLTKIKMSDI